MSEQNVIKEDEQVLKNLINYVLSVIGKDLRLLEKEVWVVFGASGFVGKWICLLGQAINQTKLLNIRVVGASRNPTYAANQLKNFFPKDIGIPEIKGNHDLLDDFSAQSLMRQATVIFYAATPTTTSLTNQRNESRTFAQAIFRSLENSQTPMFIHLSSGAVYRTPHNLFRKISETGPLQDSRYPQSDYQAIKLDMETLVREATRDGLVQGINARLFAFLGPGFPLESHFAASNFVHSAIREEDLVLMGNPETIRSYMSPQDLLIWLSQLWLHGRNSRIGNVNIGSDVPITMLELAEAVKQTFKSKRLIQFGNRTAEASYYCPDTRIFESSFAVPPLTSLREMLNQWREYLFRTMNL